VPEEQTNTSLNRLRVLHLEDTPRAKLLKQRWLYYTCQQNDGMAVDFDGYEHTPGLSYLGQRMRGVGFVPANNASIPFGQKRPICHSLSVGHIVDTYTALLLGEGRQPAVRVVGDPASTELLGALLKYCGAWSAFAEARKIGGATGASAVLPEICKGKMSLRALRPENLYVEWSDEADWIPTLVIEQKRVRVEKLDEATGRVATVEVWRTRAWDETYAYAIHDKVIQSDDGKAETEGVETPDDRIELSEQPTPHGAGRCPVVWIQNTTDSDNPVGEPDCEAVFEAVDQLDRSQSMLVRGSRANTDPTLLVKDKPMMLRRWPNNRKGYGAKLEVSEVGDAKLLEISGNSIKTAWETVVAIGRQIERRTGVIQPDPENSGAYQSGVALQLLWNTQHSRAAERRTPLGVGLKQAFAVMLTQLRLFGLREIGSNGEGVEVPPREVRAEESDDMTLEPHEIGPGGALVLDWPGFHQATPQDLQTTATALSTATGGLPSMSQETAVAHMTKLAQTDTDVAEEMDRISGERDAKEAGFFEAMRPDVDTDAELADLEGQAGEAPQTEGTEQVQHEAMNGIQVKTFGDVLARVGKDLTPEAARLTINEGFPNTREPARAAELERAIDAQLEEAAQDEKKGETISSGQRFDALGRPITRGSSKSKDVPESREREETGEQGEGEPEQDLDDEQLDP